MTSHKKPEIQPEVIYISSDTEDDEPDERPCSQSQELNFASSSPHPTPRSELELDHELDPEPESADEEPLSLPTALALLSVAPDFTDSCKRILHLVAQVPPGRYTTYKALQEHIYDTWHMTSVRIVQLSIQRNPYPSIIPCHRVVDRSGGIGVCGTEWGDHGFERQERMEILREEGARFDKNGRLLGPCFRKFASELSEVAKAVGEERERRMEKMMGSGGNRRGW